MSKYNENAFINDIRLLALNMAYKSKITYNNSILSVVPILYTLYKDHLVFDVDKPEWCNRDRLVLSMVMQVQLYMLHYTQHLVNTNKKI